MSRRTQSFFEQDNSSKNKPFYRKPKDDPSAVKRSKSALPASASTKAQLSAFSFAKPTAPKQPRIDEADDAAVSVDSANAQLELNAMTDVSFPTPVKTAPQDPISTAQTTPRRIQKDPPFDGPHTPAPRVPLSQFIGIDEVPSATQPQDTPEERVVWQTGTPRPTTRDGKGHNRHKRAASTSPILIDSPAGKRRADKFNLADITGTLKTPMDDNDPASQLWKHYSGTDSERKNPATRLFPTAGVNRSPLRRAVSSPEGLHREGLPRWKRRRTAAVDLVEAPSSENLGGSCTDPPTPVAQKKARVNRLMVEVKKNMEHRKSSPSSSPAGEDETIDLEDSPVRVRSKPVVPIVQDVEEKQDDSDEFGDFDDDIDMGFLEEVDKITSTAQQQKAVPEPMRISPAPSKIPIIHNVDDDDEDFGDDDCFFTEELQSLVAQFDTPSQTDHLPGTGNLVKKRRIQRCTVTEISVGEYIDENGRARPQTVIHIHDPSTAESRRVLLRDSWRIATNPSQGQTLNVIGSFDKYGNCTVDNGHNYVILDPDFLVSATVVADTIGCMRKSVLQERVKVSGDLSKPMIYGNILHALFQTALEANDFSTPALTAYTKEILANNIQSLFILREDIPTATDYVHSKFDLIQDWARRFVGAKPRSDGTLIDHRGKGAPTAAINKLLDIEEHVWSPLYGLKGNIDATVQAIILDGKEEKTLTLPLELKTGRNSKTMEHRAQTMLYTLLMSDRYDVNVASGLLYYLETTETIRVSAVRNELRELIIKRNQVASYILNRNVLPEMLQDQRTCGYCYAKTSCFLYHKLLEDGTPETSGVEKIFMEHTQHLNKKHQDFFRHWDTLLTKEEKDSLKFRRELWTMTSSDRQAAGRCFGDLQIQAGSMSIDPESTKINKYTYSFAKKVEDNTFSFYDSQLGVGDPIVVSDEQGHYALAIGFLSEINRNKITVQVDRRLHNTRSRQAGFHSTHNQSFNGLFEINEHSVSRGNMTVHEEILYRVDKDEFGSGMASIRNNLIQLMAHSSSDRYRKLLVELEPPVFKVESTAYQLSADSGYADLNVDQKNAVEKVMAARDYALVLGMPGTGKTTTIAHIIRALVSQNKSVLLTSYTHTAVDNILLKLQGTGIPILRLGNTTKIHPSIPSFCSLANAPGKTFEEISAALNDPPIVATTCLGINHPVFSERRFDYCIIDEASQVTLPVCIGPIRFADTFILVGDHYQLPPLVRNPAAREGGLDISLFKLLSDAHPEAVTYLAHQYRMCADIMHLSNSLIYSGRLQCGTPEVASRSLQIPNLSALPASTPPWLLHLLDPNTKAVFIDTDLLPARELRANDRITNPLEASLIHHLVTALLSTGIAPNDLGVISVYRSQLKLLQHLLRAHPIEMHTADKFQGRDKEAIVISLVRSNDQGEVGQLLADWRRINVAFTRARSKLVIFGSAKTLSANEMLRGFVELMRTEGWVYQLPEGAGEGLEVGAGGSPARGKGRGRGDGPKRVSGKAQVVARQEFWDERPVLRDLKNDSAPCSPEEIL